MLGVSTCCSGHIVSTNKFIEESDRKFRVFRRVALCCCVNISRLFEGSLIISFLHRLTVNRNEPRSFERRGTISQKAIQLWQSQISQRSRYTHAKCTVVSVCCKLQKSRSWELWTILTYKLSLFLKYICSYSKTPYFSKCPSSFMWHLQYWAQKIVLYTVGIQATVVQSIASYQYNLLTTRTLIKVRNTR
jgi:hypothetical protein